MKKSLKLVFAFVLVFVTAAILASSITYCVMAKQADKKQEQTKVKVKVKQPKIIHSKFNYSILNSETALKDAVVIAEANIKNKDLIDDIFAPDVAFIGRNNEYIIWGANYDKKSNIFSVKTLLLHGIGCDDMCYKELGIYKFPMPTVMSYNRQTDDVFAYQSQIACMDNYKEPDALSLSWNYAAHLVGNTLIYKDSKNKKVIKLYSDRKNGRYFYNTITIGVKDMENQKFLYSDSNNPQDYINVENLPNKMIYRDKNGDIIETYEAEVIDNRDGNPVVSRITVSDKDGNVQKIVIFDKS